MKKLRNNIKLIYSNFLSDQCYLRASSLSYITFLGFIPFLIVILLFTPAITFQNIQEAIINFVFTLFVPKSAEAIQSVVSQLLERRVGLNVMGFVLLVLTSFFLFKSISTTFDKILCVSNERKHSLFREFEKFVATIIGGVIMVAVLLFTASLPMIDKYLKLALIIKILPFLGIFFLLFVIYKYVTSIHPKTSSTVIGAAFTSIIWIILKFGFDWYIATFTNVRSVYGTLGAFPIFMIWLYFNWVTILFGMEIVSFYSGNKTIKEKKEEKPDKIRVKLTIEKNFDEDIPKELKEFEFLDSDKENVLEIIKAIVKKPQNQETENKENDDLQKE